MIPVGIYFEIWLNPFLYILAKAKGNDFVEAQSLPSHLGAEQIIQMGFSQRE